MKISKINDQISVAYQIELSDIKNLNLAGFKVIIDNRPDGETEQMPDFDEIKQVANAQGLICHYIPVGGREAISKEMIAKSKAILNGANGPILAYCRTGTRSIILWALAQKDEMSAHDIIQLAKNAGYDIEFLRKKLS